MKKYLVLLLVLTLTLAFASCGGGQTTTTTTTNQNLSVDPPAHVHDYIPVVTDPTCTEQGYTTYTCECGKEYVKDYTEIIAHKFGDWETVKEATNTEDGLRERRCECGELQQEVIEASNTEYYITYRNTKTVYPEENGYDSKKGLALPWIENEAGYEFLGWYTAPNGSGEFMDEIPAGSTKNYTLYAHWNIIEYDIYYEYGINNSGYTPTNSNKTEYTVEDQFALSEPYWSGLVFTHWTDENGNKVTKIDKGSTGDLTLTAHWITYENLVQPSSNLALAHVFDENTGLYYFIYELGVIENVVLDTVVADDAYYNKTTSSPKTLTISKTVTVEESKALTITESNGKSVTESTSWSKSQERATGVTVGMDYELSVDIEVDLGVIFTTNVKNTFGLSAEEEQKCVNTKVDGGGTDTETSTSHSMAYVEELGVSTSTETTTSKTITGDMPNGYYTYVHAGNVRVFSVVTFDPKTQNYSITTLSTLDNVHLMDMYYPELSYMNKEMPTLEYEFTDAIFDEIEDVFNSSYYIVYDGGEGVEDSVHASKHPVGKDSNLLANTYTKEGYELIGWNTEPDGSGTTYIDGAIVNDLGTAGNTITLYAMWKVAYSMGLEYTLNNDNNSYSVTGVGSCTDTDIVIPHTYNSLPVTTIDYEAFLDCNSLTSVVIGESVMSIGEAAFYNCDSLTSVVIGESVTSIGDYAFKGCASLTSVIIGDSVMSIGYSAFYNCDSLTSVEFGENSHLTTICAYAFYNCDSLTSVVIPDSVTSIGEWAFAGCTSLTSVEIGDSVTSIGYSAFYNCDSLTSIEIPDSVTSIGYEAFYGCDSLTSVVIGDSVTSIGMRTFSHCYSLTGVEIGDSVRSIGNSAFSTCSSLTSVVIGNSVTSIGDDAFWGCWDLTSIVIPDSVTSIGEGAFHDCNSLTSVEIGDSVTSIGDYAFCYCTSLTSITFKNPEGWWYASSSTATSGTSLSATQLADPTTAATYLTSTYISYYWNRTE